MNFSEGAIDSVACAACGHAVLQNDTIEPEGSVPNEDDCFWIQCDLCLLWYHGKCVSIEEFQSAFIDQYHCSGCEMDQGPSIYKKHLNDHRYAFDEGADGKPVQIGTKEFVKQFKKSQDRFPDAGGVLDIFENGHDFDAEYLEKTGWRRPICIENRPGLGLRIPEPDFTVRTVLEQLGPDYGIDAIDVYRQHSYRMTLESFVKLWEAEKRPRLYNVLSMEFSNTRLASLVQLPTVATDISWVHKFWPEQRTDLTSAEVLTEHLRCKPEVAMFLLMGMKDSYTDFHIDFGGSSVWYHVFKGEKVFYLIEPTDSHLVLFHEYMKNPNRSEHFFADSLPPGACVRATVKEGETLMIPSGWIHAVLTPVDSIVFGGNFLHSIHIDMQLRVHEMEVSLNTDERFMFPSFELTNWYGANIVIEALAEANEEKRTAHRYLVLGAQSLLRALKRWTLRDKSIKTSVSAKYGKTVQHLQRELNAQKKLKGSQSKLKIKFANPKRANLKTAVKRPKQTLKTESKSPEKGERLQIRLKVPKPSPEKNPAPLKLKLNLTENVSHPCPTEGDIKLAFGMDRLLKSPNKFTTSPQVKPESESSKTDHFPWPKDETSPVVGYSLLELNKDSPPADKPEAKVEAAPPQVVTVNTAKQKVNKGVDVSSMFGVSSHGRVQKPSNWVSGQMVEFVPELGQHCHEDSNFVYPSMVDADDSVLPRAPIKKRVSQPEAKPKPEPLPTDDAACQKQAATKAEIKAQILSKRKGQATTKQRLASKLKIKRLFPV